MALVLRKAVLPRNVSFLKCIKGRQLATTSHKQNPAPLSRAALCRSSKYEKRAVCLGYKKIGNSRRMSSLKACCKPRKPVRMRLCMSCPNLVPEERPKIRVSTRHHSPPRTRPACAIAYSTSPLLRNYTFLRAKNIASASKRAYSKCSCDCPCPFPCGPCGNASGCNCLPPPCNVPPKCIQYMTGYYYYPYGTWFCGPYHVTGTCAPVGPCPPSAPCGPCLPSKCCCFCSTGTGSISPAATVYPLGSLSGSTNTQEMPKSNGFPDNIRSPYSFAQGSIRTRSKSNISRFSPSKDTESISSLKKKFVDPKKQLPSTAVLSSLISPYSSRSQWPDVENVVDPMPGVGQLETTSSNASQHQYNSNPLPSSYDRTSARGQSTKSCPPLEKPKTIMTQEQRDKPRFKPGAFDYASIPSYRNPYPSPNINIEIKPYET